MLWGEPFTVSVTAIDKKHLPTTRSINGSGKNPSPIRHKVKDHNLIKIINSDNYCLFRSLSATFIFSTCSWPKWKFYDYMHSRLGMKKRLEHDTTFLMENVGAPLDLTTYDANEWVPKVVDYWNSRNDGLFKVFIFGELGEKPIFKYGDENHTTPILLYYNNNHFDGVRKASDLFGKPYCLSCEIIYNRPKDHSITCTSKCQNCSRIGPNYPCQPLDNYFKHCSEM
ncbi:unnamed protein product [Meloidogyne enterolobii]|uniref:Uncharacterized protein n=1 Tax=Meloidogyne enterolobii TaxID=390850 RepID=A0ACB1A402_MELEN